MWNTKRVQLTYNYETNQHILIPGSVLPSCRTSACIGSTGFLKRNARMADNINTFKGWKTQALCPNVTKKEMNHPKLLSYPNRRPYSMMT